MNNIFIITFKSQWYTLYKIYFSACSSILNIPFDKRFKADKILARSSYELTKN